MHIFFCYCVKVCGNKDGGGTARLPNVSGREKDFIRNKLWFLTFSILQLMKSFTCAV